MLWMSFASSVQRLRGVRAVVNSDPRVGRRACGVASSVANGPRARTIHEAAVLPHVSAENQAKLPSDLVVADDLIL